MNLLALDWHAMWVPGAPVLETILRGSIIYLVLLAVLRLLRRETGSLGLTDVLLVVLIGDAAQQAMAWQHRSITDGVILIATICAWDYGLDWLGYRFKTIQRLLRPPPLLLVKDGQMMRKNMRHEMVTPEELLSQLRQHGVDSVERVRECYFEGDGHFSVITRDSPDTADEGKPPESPLRG